MNFIYPNFLWALSLISIPIIIHLFRFRKFKKIYFSDTSLLNTVFIEKQNKNKIKNLILLVIRILIITFLVLAFAQPYFPGKFNTKGKKTICIYIDNSPSMENVSQSGKLLDQARMIARNIIESHGLNDEYQIVTNELSFKELRFYNQDDARLFINEITIYPHTRKLSNLLSKIHQSFENSNKHEKIVYLISDFQNVTTDFKKLTFLPSVNYYLIPLKPNSVGNITIDSCWISQPLIYPGQMVSLFVSIKNYHNENLQDKQLRLILNGQLKAINYSINGNETKVIEIPVMIGQKGWVKGVIETDDYPVNFDDRYYFTYNVRENINVLIVENQKNKAIEACFSTDKFFNYKSVNETVVQIKPSDKTDFIILNEPQNISEDFLSELNDFVLQGGALLLIPPKEMNNKWTNIIKRFGLSPFESVINAESSLTKIQEKHPFFQGIFEKTSKRQIDLPGVKKYYSRSSNYLNTEYALLEFENNKPFLTLTQFGRGIIYTLSVPLDLSWSNFTRHSLFVPVLYQMNLYKTHQTPLSFILGKNQYAEITTSKSANQIKVRYEDKSFIPPFKYQNNNLIIQLDHNFQHDGFYEIISGENNVIACNYDRTESNLNYYPSEELKKLSQDNIKVLSGSAEKLSKSVKELNYGTPLWKILIWLVFILLLSEVLITRFYKIV